MSNSKQYFRPGEDATFSCTTGNRLYTEHDSVTCQRDGTWDRSVPTCDPQTCKSPPLIQHGGYDEDGDSFSVGFMVQYSCDYGYKLKENNLNQKGKIQCLPSGEWESNLPQCLVITCRTPPVVPNSRRTYSSLELLSTVEYDCERGFNMNGENTLECYENGFWDPAPPDCDPVDCGPAESPPNSVATTGSTTFGNTVTYQCKPGYYLNIATRRTCLENGTWSGIPPRCLPVSCGQPENIEHGTRIGESFLFMNNIHYRCDPGYNLIGESTRRCTGTGAWTSNIPTCTKLECPPPLNIDNGYYTPSDFYYENIVTYQCEVGYYIQGNASIQCISSGQWSPLSATCEPVLCPVLIVPTGGNITSTGRTFRSMATFSCNEGYTMDGETIRICQPEGYWSGISPTCTPVTCPVLTIPDNGNITTTGQTLGSYATFSCNEGYNMVGENIRICQPEGYWSASSPTCESVLCPTLAIPDGGNLTTTGQMFSSIATYSCNDGYRMNGVSIRICQPEGYWSGNAPSCTAVICPALDIPGNGNINITGRTFGRMAIYSCNDGYTMNGETIRICQSEGSWSGSVPICEIVLCPAPTLPDNGLVETTDQNFNSIATYSCDNGYTLEGERIRTCQSDQTWSGVSPICKLVLCPALTMPDHGSIVTNGLTYGSMATYSCNTGYSIEGQNIRNCQSDGDWSGIIPTCNPVICPALTIPENGNLDTSGLIFRSTTTYSCNVGYTINGNSTRLCQSDRNWSGLPPICEPVLCPVLSIPEGGKIVTTGQIFNSVAIFTCNDGYRINGEAVRRCNSEGHWSGISPICDPVLCPTLAIPDGGNLSTTGQTFSSMATYSCNDGYRMNGESIRICQPEGYWSGNAPSCTAVICPALDIPGNGNINITGRTFGRMAIYSCNDGYTMNGETIRICQSEGSWSGSVPICEIVLCPAPTLPDNGLVETTDQNFNSIATYSCDNGYTLEGERIRTCQSDQTWSGVSPICKLVLCPALTMPDHGSIVTNGLTYGSMATYSCNTGYSIEGQNIRNCQSDGDWSGIIPTCNPVICPALTIPENGNLDTSGLIFRSTTTYSCNVGYTINGNSTRLCQSDRNWSGLPPICEPVLCPVLSIPEGGKIVTTGQIFNSVAIFTCNDGYRINGEAVRRCNSEGHWSSVSPICDPVLCPMLAIPDNGHVVTNGQTFRSVATYTCNAGYTLIGEDVQICQSEGQWSNREPYCEPVRCPELTIPNNGSVETTGLTFLSSATYLCNDGYTMEGKNSANCQADGNWSSSVPKCSPVLCPELNLLDYGTVSVTGQTFRSVATYSCNDGYIMEGEEIRTCLAEGIWSGTVPNCISTTCVPPSTIRNGVVNYKDLHIESVVFYLCDDGFRLIGDDVRRCGDNLTWSGFQPSCVVITCQDLPQIANGQQSTTGLVYNSVASFECDRGYELQGTDELICTKTGEWSAPLPSCSAIECETPGRIISNGRMFGDMYTVGSVISYECDIGYNLQGSRNRTCLSTGHWKEQIPVCEIVRCNPPRLSHGLASTFKNEYNTRITFSCNQGYVLFGPIERLCLVNGNWSGSNPVCVKCNDPPNLENGFVSIDDEIATYGCIPGYHLIGNNKLECQMDGSWINELPVCLAVDCDDLEDEVFEHGNRTQTGYYFGDTSEYICEEGFNLIGSAMRRCQTDGSWSGLPPVCLIVRCPGTFEILNGRIEGDNVYDSTLTFTCNEGFRINGEYILTCLSTGSWSGTAPFCEIILCEQLPTIPYGSVSFNTLTVGSKAAYSCDQSYELIGKPIRECLNTARWSGTEPLCSQLECPPPNSIDHGTIISNARTVGQVIRYNCDEGYRLQGISFRLCLHQKMWSGLDPMCVPVKCQSPSPLNHGQIVNLESEYKFGDIIQYECNEGYNLIGEAERECTSQGSRGRWSSIAPTCNQVSCGPPNDINNAVISVLNDNSFLYGTMLSIECIDGYTSLSGKSLTSTCTSEGIWSVTFLECFKTQCPPLDPLINGNIAGSGFSFNDMVTFSCNDGFSLKGPTSIKCLSTSRWSTAELPLCELIICPAPEQLANGFLRGNNYTFGNSIIYECNSGYTLRGDRSRICLKNGIWSGRAPSCSVVTCQLPEAFPNGQWNTSDVSLPYDSTIGFICNVGYIPDKENKLLCSETGIWVGNSVSCSIIQCPYPSQVLNGRAIYNDVTYNNEVDYICNDGYHLIGDGKLRCSETGAWDKPVPTCEPVNCGAPNFVAFADIVGGVYTLGNTVTYICQQGYIMAGEAIRICTPSGHWSGYAPLCNPITCDIPPDVDNAIRLGIDFTYQSSVIYACNTGYRSVGATSLSCGMNGQWLGDLPLCEIVTCGPPPVVPSSNTIVTAFTYGSTVSYYCDLGYILHGDPIAMCNQNGQWSSSGNTTCLLVDCGRPVDILNGNVQYDSTTYQSTSTYSCNNMHRLTGESTLKCGSNGLWEGVVPFCDLTSCGTPIISSNVRVLGGGSFAIGETITYVCPEGHILVGNVKRNCMENGLWSGVNPECLCKYNIMEIDFEKNIHA